SFSRDWSSDVCSSDLFIARRDRALLELIYSSGLRLAEVTGLDLSDIDLQEGMVNVTGKGSKQRILPVGRYAIAALQEWLPERARRAPADQTAVFISQRGTRIGHRAVQLRMQQLSVQQG